MVSAFTSTRDTSINSVRNKTRDTPKGTAREIARQMSQECVARRLRQANRTITRLYDEALRPHGLTVNQLNILAVIISEKQIQPGQLAQALGMEKSTVSRSIDRMVKKNWIAVHPGSDSRTQILKVTLKGRNLLLSVTPIWDNLQAGVLADASSGNNILQMLTLAQTENSISDKAFNKAPDKAPDKALDYASEWADEPVSADDFYL